MTKTVRRLLGLVAGLAVLVTVSFAILQLMPGDPARRIAGPMAPEDYVEGLRQDLGLDRPLLTQYWDYMSGVLRGDLGESFRTGRPVVDTLQLRLPASLSLAAVALVITVVAAVTIGGLVGYATAGGRRQPLLVAFSAVTGVLSSVPGFMIGVGLVYLFGVRYQWLPVSGRDGWTSYVLPAIALSLAPTAALARMVRVQTDVVLDEEYIRVARSKRLKPSTIQLRHVLPNLLTSVLTVGGTLLAGLVGSAVVIENVFNWPGIGSEVVAAISAKDYPIVQGAVIVLGTIALMITAVVNLSIAALDPRSTLASDL